MRTIWTLLAVALALSGCVKESDGDGRRISVGDRLPAFQLVEEDILDAPEIPREFDSRDLGGRKTLIYFLWVGCPECRETTPYILEAWEQIRVRDDIQLVCIARGGTMNKASREDAIEYWEGLAEQENAPSPMPPLFYDEDRRVFDQFAEQGVPRFYLADASGIVRWEHLGSASSAELIRQIDDL